MCRMFGYIGYSSDELNLLYTALVESSRNDVIGKKYGYGMVVYTNNNLLHFRSSRPIYEEAFKLPELKGKIFGVFHTMNAHDKSLISPIFINFLAIFSELFAFTIRTIVINERWYPNFAILILHANSSITPCY